jgi:hypothetical protein
MIESKSILILNRYLNGSDYVFGLMEMYYRGKIIKSLISLHTVEQKDFMIRHGEYLLRKSGDVISAKNLSFNDMIGKPHNIDIITRPRKCKGGLKYRVSDGLYKELSEIIPEEIHLKIRNL